MAIFGVKNHDFFVKIELSGPSGVSEVPKCILVKFTTCFEIFEHFLKFLGTPWVPYLAIFIRDELFLVKNCTLRKNGFPFQKCARQKIVFFLNSFFEKWSLAGRAGHSVLKRVPFGQESKRETAIW